MNGAVNIHVQAFVKKYSFSFGDTPRSRISGSYSNSVFNYLWNCQTILQRGYAILHSHLSFLSLLSEVV